MFKNTLFVFILSLTTSLSAQNDFGTWYMSFNTVKFGQHWQFQNDIQYRSFNFGNDLEQLMLRGGVGYNLTEENNNLLQGYAFIRSGEMGTENQSDEQRVNEHRFYQQFITKQHFGRFYIAHRYRLEERFIEENFKIRFRYFLNMKVALSQPKIGTNTIYAAFYNEIFVHGQGVLFDRNRLYGAMGFSFSPKTRVEVGMMAQLYQNTYRTQLQLGFFKTLDFRQTQ